MERSLCFLSHLYFPLTASEKDKNEQIYENMAMLTNLEVLLKFNAGEHLLLSSPSFFIFFLIPFITYLTFIYVPK